MAARKSAKPKAKAPWTVSHGWQELQTEDGLTYYYNAAMDITQEEKPDVLKTVADHDSDGAYVWAEDAEHGYVPAKVVETHDGGGPALLETEMGKQLKVKKGAAVPLSLHRPSLRVDHDDLVQMGVIDEGIILHNLRERFKRDEIYTSIGTILIVVNPYKWFKIYTEEIMQEYRAKGMKVLKPHIFEIADNAFRQMSEALAAGNPPNQSILISGESGAGKTEATKQALRYLAHVAGSASSGIEERLLMANPLLEAFGNAATLRNNNSSRFGKWMEVFFDDRRTIVGANIRNYLLEKSRVTQQAAGERNYHIFYAITSAAKPELKRRFKLADAHAYRYSRTHTTIADKSWNEAKNFEEVLAAFDKMGMAAERDDVLRIVAAVLHFGNIDFVPGAATDSSAVANPAVLGTVAELLQVPVDALERAVVVRTLSMGKKESVVVPLTPDKAADNRDALAKSLYAILFDWLVWRVNGSINPDGSSAGTAALIGILDIFGFEIFEKNSFEQLCINFTNEKLQQHFNAHTFKLEQQLYQAEGIAFQAVTFIDNQPCLDLIEGRPDGILSVLDEELLTSGSDARFVEKLLTKHEGRSERFGRAIKLRVGFKVFHYAGEVSYDATGFLDKNRDRLEQDLLSLVRTTSNEFLSALFQREAASAANRTKSIASQFRSQLEALMVELNSTDPHYVRCIKPNSHKRPSTWEGYDILQQLRYAGIFEAVQIRQTGFPWRYRHAEFIARYGVFIAFRDSRDPSATCQDIIDNAGVDVSEVQLGRTRVFFRARTHRALEIKRSIVLQKAALKIQKTFRGLRARVLYRNMRAIARILRDAMAMRDLPKLRAAVDKARSMWFQLRLTDEAETLCVALEEGARVRALLAALQDKDPEAHYEAIIDAVKRAHRLGLETTELARCEANIAEIHIRKQAVKDLIEGTRDNDKARIVAGIDMATSLGLPVDAEIAAARVALERIEREEALIRELERALATAGAGEETTGLASALEKARRFKMQTPGGRALEAGFELAIAIRTAIRGADWRGLQIVVTRALEAKTAAPVPDLARAQEGLRLRTEMEAVAVKLGTAVGAKDAPRMERCIGDAARLEMETSQWSSWRAEARAGREALARHLRLRATLEASIARGADRRIGVLADAIAEAEAYGFLADDDLTLLALAVIVHRLRAAIAARDFDELADALHDARSDGAVHHEIDAADRGLSLRKLMAVVARYLRDAVTHRDIDALEEGLAKAEDLDMEDSLWSSWQEGVPEARAVAAEHKRLCGALEGALGAGTAHMIEPLRAAVAAAAGFGFGLDEDLELLAEAKVTLRVREALRTLDWAALDAAVEAAAEAELESPELDAAGRVLDLRADMSDVAAELQDALTAHDGRTLAELLVEADGLAMATSQYSSWGELVVAARDALRVWQVLRKLLNAAVAPGTEGDSARLASAIERCEAFGMDAPDDEAAIEAAKLVLAVRRAVAVQQFGKVAKVVALYDSEDCGHLDAVPELEAAREGLLTRKRMAKLAEFLDGAVEDRDVAAVTEALVRADELQLEVSPWSTWGDAVVAARKFLKARADAGDALADAMGLEHAESAEGITLLTTALDGWAGLELQDEGDLVTEERGRFLLLLRVSMAAKDYAAAAAGLEEFAYLAWQTEETERVVSGLALRRQSMAPVGAALDAAIGARSVVGIREALEAAHRLHMDSSRWSDWGPTMELAVRTMQAHKGLVRNLLQAINPGGLSLPEVGATLAQCAAFGLTLAKDRALVARVQILHDIRAALALSDTDALAEALAAAAAAGFTNEEVIEAERAASGSDAARARARAAFGTALDEAIVDAINDNDRPLRSLMQRVKAEMSGALDEVVAKGLRRGAELLGQIEATRHSLARGLRTVDLTALSAALEAADEIGFVSEDYRAAKVLASELAGLGGAARTRGSGLMEADEAAAKRGKLMEGAGLQEDGGDDEGADDKASEGAGDKDKGKLRVSRVDGNGEMLPKGWRMVWDAQSGRNYYVHAKTKTTQWKRPTE